MSGLHEISLRERIRLNLVSAMENAGINQVQLAERLGISKGTVNNWARGNNSPDVDMVPRICKVLGISVLDLYSPTKCEAQETVTQIRKAPSYSDEAMKLAKGYDGLDGHGKTMMQVVLSEEQKRMEEELRRQRERRERYDALSALDGEPVEPRVIPLYLTPAAAGYASPAFGEDFEYLEVEGDVPAQADFAVRIDGDSMEPYLMDGSVAYVNRDPLADGDIGIFYVDGDMLCKEYHRDPNGDVRLLSLNRERADADRYIPANSGTTLACYGRVILPRY